MTVNQDIRRIDVWYNRSARSWVVQYFDHQQELYSDYVYSKREAKLLVAEFPNIPVNWS